jgi:hypothetical protein
MQLLGRIRSLDRRPYRSRPGSLAPVTRDDAAVPIIVCHACPATGRVARHFPLDSSVGRGQNRKSGAEDDCRGNCDLCHIGHGPISFVCSPIRGGSATRLNRLPKSKTHIPVVYCIDTPAVSRRRAPRECHDGGSRLVSAETVLPIGGDVRLWHKADIPIRSINAAFGGKADIGWTFRNVCYRQNSGAVGRATDLSIKGSPGKNRALLAMNAARLRRCTRSHAKDRCRRAHR